MTEGQQQLWKMRLQEWGSLLAGALVGAAVVYLCRTYLAVLTGREAMVLGPVIGAVLGWGAHFAWDMSRGSSPGAGVSSGTLALMRLEEFLAIPDAVVAPNQDEEVSQELAKWLRAYAKAHGPDSVWVLPYDDDVATSEVYLVAKELSASEREALSGFGADGVGKVSARKIGLAVEGSVFQVLWD
ncbi:hypothetical protein [Brevifollis gellanilyticus]|nr:hypothetical protein [Brevifollis gellanilyticus]